MAPCKNVPNLKDIAQLQVLYNICAVILHEKHFSKESNWNIDVPTELSTRLQLFRKLLEDELGASFMQDILNIILSKDDEVEVTIRYIALKLLLVEGVQVLAVGHFPESYYSSVLEAVAASAANLERLDLKGIWVRQQDKFSLCKALRRLHRMKHLILRYVCDDELLQIVGRHCPELTKLDISGSESIAENGIDSLIDNNRLGPGSHISKSLQIVDIGGPGALKLSSELGSKLILGLPNLESLGSFAKTGHALEIAYQKRRMATFKLRYIHDLNTTGERLSLIVQTCPDLQAIYMDSPGKVAVHNLYMSTKLTEIKLNKVKWADLEILLQKCGNRLRHLFLLRVWGQFNIIKLGEYCPKLRRFELHHASLSCLGTDHPTAFKTVEDLLIYNTPVSPMVFKFLISQGVSIKHLTLGECDQIADTDLMSSLSDNQGSETLKKVVTIWLACAEQLTIESLLTILQECPVVESIGNLYTWNMIPPEIDLIRTQAFLTNANLTLQEYGPHATPENHLMLLDIDDLV